MKYRKKPIIVEAFQYDGDLKGTNGEYYIPQWAVTAYEDGSLFYKEYLDLVCLLFCKTLEGNMLVSVGDYVIRGIKGELYPCKSDIFEMTYDLVEEDWLL